MDVPKGQSQLSARQKDILYMFDILGTYGEDLQLEVSPAETETLLRECDNVLVKLSECESSINADTWKELGHIRDGLVALVEKNFGADNNFSNELKFESLNSTEMSSLSSTMNIMSANVPNFVAEMAKSGIVIIKAVLSRLDNTPGGTSAQDQLSDRQKEILYTFDVLDTNGDDLYLDFSRAEAEALLRECDNVLLKVSECHGPIDADTWDGLGKIRDGLVELLEKKFGADNNLSTMLKFDRLDSQEMSSLSHDMNISASVPSSVAERATSAITILKDALHPLDSTPGGISAERQLSNRQKQIVYTFSMLQTYGEDLDLKVSPPETEALLRACETMWPKVLEFQGPIDADTWKWLGGIRDGFVKLVEQKSEAGDEFPDKLKFETLDSLEKSSLSRSMHTICQNEPGGVAVMARVAIAIIKDIIRPGVGSSF